MFSRLFFSRHEWRCECLDGALGVSDRQERIEGWKRASLSRATGLFLGAGGINGEICEGVVRKGLGAAHIVDLDEVTPSNLNRQKFLKKDLYRNKARCLCRNLRVQGYLGTRLVPHPCWYQDLNVEEIKPDFVVCSVDPRFPNTRLEVCKFCHSRGIPCVFVAVSTDADYGYIFVQTPGNACWACVFKPEMTDPERVSESDRCPSVPACVDILKALAGHALYAIDTLIMTRKRDWNYRVVSLGRSDFGSSHLVPRREGCVVCGGKGQGNE
jgi:molybdopterin/thiamine biosynthesis adenylyltransferase